MFFSRQNSLRWALATLAMPLAVYPQTNTITSVSAANYRAIVSPSSVVSGWGSGFTATTVTANTNPPVTLPTALGGFSLSLVDSANNRQSPALYFVSPGQINYVLPDNTAVGRATVTASVGGASGVVLVSSVAPAIFTADGSGNGVPAAQVLHVNTTTNASGYESPFQSGTSTYQPKPIDITNPAERVYLVLYGTGIRSHSLNPVIAVINGVQTPVAYAGLQSTYPGLDQINVGPLPVALAGSGTVNAVITVDGVPANTVQIAFK